MRAGKLDADIEAALIRSGSSVRMLKEMLDDEPTLEGKTIHFYHCDHLGTPIALINKQGEVDWQISLNPWGNTIKEHNPKNIQQPIRFQGQQFDEESGLHYNRHRYYDPRLGRYISQDPIGLAGGMNVFVYPVNPISFVDPLGLACDAPMPPVNSDDRKVAATCYGEASNPDQCANPQTDPAKEKQAITDSIYNRVSLNKNYLGGPTVSGVLNQPNQYLAVTGRNKTQYKSAYQSPEALNDKSCNKLKECITAAQNSSQAFNSGQPPQYSFDNFNQQANNWPSKQNSISGTKICRQYFRVVDGHK